MPRTLYDKIWDDHVVETEGGSSLIYIDRHLIHEVTSPQAFEGLRLSGRKVRAPEKTLAVVDHNIQTTDRSAGIADPESRQQVETLAANAKEFGIEYYDEFDSRQGVGHGTGGFGSRTRVISHILGGAPSGIPRPHPDHCQPHAGNGR